MCGALLELKQTTVAYVCLILRILTVKDAFADFLNKLSWISRDSVHTSTDTVLFRGIYHFSQVFKNVDIFAAS